jgi:putative salt-induced outer membrane protein YdiY
MKKLCTIAAAVLALATFARADEVVMKNGDKLDGTIVNLDAGKITLKTAFAGDIKIDATQVSTLSTDNPINLKLADGTLINRKLSPDATGGVQVEGGLLGSSHLNVADISAINPAPVVWTGDIKFGGLLIRGNTQSDSINFGFDFDHKTDVDELSFTAAYLYGTTHDRTTAVSTTSAENWQTDLKYLHDLTKKIYAFADLQVSKDRIAFLDLRVAPSAGLGYRWFNKPDFTFSTEGGIAWIYQQYTNDTPHREDVSLVLSYHVTKSFNDSVSLFHNLSYYPSIQNGRNFLVDTDLGLHVALLKQLFTEFKVVLDYDSHPANGALKTDTRIELNLGYKI